MSEPEGPRSQRGAAEVDRVISELGRRIGANPESASRWRRETAEEGGPDPDFALSLSSASLRLAEERANPTPSTVSTPSTMPSLPAAPAAAAESTEPARSGPVGRVIEAYREIARPASGERIRIVV